MSICPFLNKKCIQKDCMLYTSAPDEEKSQCALVFLPAISANIEHSFNKIREDSVVSLLKQIRDELKR